MDLGKTPKLDPKSKLGQLFQKVVDAKEATKAKEIEDKGGPDTKGLDDKLKMVYEREYERAKAELIEANDNDRRMGLDEYGRLSDKEISDWSNDMAKSAVGETCRQHGLPNPYSDDTKYGKHKDDVKDAEKAQEAADEAKSSKLGAKPTEVQAGGIQSNL